MVFPVVTYGCESWTVKKDEHRRIDAFELWCWRRLLRVPWTARRSNQSILKEISPGCSLEGLMLKLKLQSFGHLMQRADSLEKTLMLGTIGGRRRGDNRGWDGWMVSLPQWTWVWVNSGSWWWTGKPGVLRFMGLQRVGHNWVTELNWMGSLPCFYSYYRCFLQNALTEQLILRGCVCVFMSLASVSNTLYKYTFLIIRNRNSRPALDHPSLVHLSPLHIYNLTLWNSVIKPHAFKCTGQVKSPWISNFSKISLKTLVFL